MNISDDNMEQENEMLQTTKLTLNTQETNFNTGTTCGEWRY